jgi:hypothetical protein
MSKGPFYLFGYMYAEIKPQIHEEFAKVYGSSWFINDQNIISLLNNTLSNIKTVRTELIQQAIFRKLLYPKNSDIIIFLLARKSSLLHQYS